MANRVDALAAAAIWAAFLLGQFSLGGIANAKPSPKEKNVKRTALQVHPQTGQDGMDVTGSHGDKDVVVREWDGPLYVEASLVYWEGDERTVSLVLAIENSDNQDSLPAPKPPKQLFAPSTILVLLPNGHSYRPFSQADVLPGGLHSGEKECCEHLCWLQPAAGNDVQHDLLTER